MRNILVLCLVLLTGCGSASKYSSSVDRYNSQGYQDRDEISKSLFGKKDEDLSEENIAKILSSKITLPRKLTLAVFKLDESNSAYHSFWASRSSSIQSLSTKMNNSFIGKLKKSPRIEEVVWMPSLMKPESVSLNTLRASAVRLQADLLLVYRVESYSDYEYNLFEKNKAKTIANIEFILLDIRTGLVPFTSIISASTIEDKNSEDFSSKETVLKSKMKAEGESLSLLGDDLRTFIEKF